MTSKPNLHGIKTFKSFNDFIKDLSQKLEKEHTRVHNDHVKSMNNLKELHSKPNAKGKQ